MPTYDYVCSLCGHEMEVVHSVHGSGPEACPKCGGKMRKSFAPPAVVFKGTGWARKERSGGRPAKTPPSEAKADDASSSPAPASKSTTTSDAD